MTISAEKKLGHNTQLKQGATTIAQVLSVKMPGYDRDEVEVTTLDSTIMDFIPGDPPEITEIIAELIWVSGLTSHELFTTSVTGKTNDAYSIVVQSWTTSRTFAFSAYCTRTDPQEVASKNPMRLSVRLRPTTVVTVT